MDAAALSPGGRVGGGAPRRGRRPRSGEEGFTLVEVLLALVITAVVLVGLQGAVGRFVRAVGATEREAVALELAEERLETVLLDPRYHGLAALYATVEDPVPGFPEYVRETRVVRTRIPVDSVRSVDYQTITVTVMGPLPGDSVSRTGVVGAP